MLRLGMGRAQVAAIFSSSYAWNWGPQELAYGYVSAVGTTVDSSCTVVTAAR
jgi:hypothetical protein